MPFKPPAPVEDKPSGTAFKPPPPVEDQERPSVLSRFGTGLYESTVGPLVKTVQDIPGTVSNIVGIPDLKQASTEFGQGNYGRGLAHIGHAANLPGRMAEGTMEPIVQDVQGANLAGATGRGLGTAAMLALPIAEARIPAVGSGLRATGVGLKTAAPDVIKGGLRAGVAGTIGETIPHGGFVMAHQTLKGLQQAGEGLQKGFQAAREAYNKPPLAAQGGPVGDVLPSGRRVGGLSEGRPVPSSSTAAPPKVEPITPGTRPPRAKAPQPNPKAESVPTADATLKDQIARGQAGKPYTKLNPDQQAAVDNIAAKMQPPPPLATPSNVKGLGIAEQLRDAMAERSPEAKINESGILEYPNEGWPEPEVFAESRRPFKAMELAQPFHEVGITSQSLENLGGKPSPQLRAAVKGLGINKTGDISPETLQMVIEELKKLESRKQ